MTIRFGVSPIAWVNDDMPELGGDTPLATVLTDAQEIGFEGIELGGIFPRDAETLQPLLDAHGLALVGGWYSGSLLSHSVEAEIDALQSHLALLKAMGSDVFIIAETSNAVHGDRSVALGGSPRLNDEQWPAFGTKLTALARYLDGQGLRLAYHHHLGTVVETAADMDAFFAHSGPEVGIVLDTGHAALGGVDPLAIIASHPDRIAHVHCKDIRRATFATVRDRQSFLDGVLAGMFTVPGDGDLDFPAVMHALKAIDYQGWIIVEAEQDPALADPKVYGRLGLDSLKAAARAAGLREA
jgi:inosose dehydratase